VSGSPRPRYIILTAGYGEGHNSAAAHLAYALEPYADTHVLDPCHSGAPRINHLLRIFYRIVTTHFPKIWKKIYDSTETQDFSNQKLPFMRGPESYLEEQISTLRPDGIICTYPLYPYFCERIFEAHPRVPIFTAVTDSIEVNGAWRNSPSDFFLLTDNVTKEYLIKQSMPVEKLVVTGFAVHPRFSSGFPLQSDSSIEPFKVLYFPTAKKPHVRRIIRAILQSDPRTEVTVVMGKNVRLLYSRAKSLTKEFPARVKLKGWTRKVPELLMEHHLVIGKAGGATVHEAIAAQCPMLIHHLVPGQEEGNLELLKHIGGGQLTESAADVRATLADLLADDAAGWRKMKQHLTRHAKPAASQKAAQFILSHTR